MFNIQNMKNKNKVPLVTKCSSVKDLVPYIDDAFWSDGVRTNASGKSDIKTEGDNSDDLFIGNGYVSEFNVPTKQ